VVCSKVCVDIQGLLEGFLVLSGDYLLVDRGGRGVVFSVVAGVFVEVGGVILVFALLKVVGEVGCGELVSEKDKGGVWC